MKILTKIIISIVASFFSFLIAFFAMGDSLIMALIIATSVLAAILILLSIDQFFQVDSEFLFCGGAGAIAGGVFALLLHNMLTSAGIKSGRWTLVIYSASMIFFTYIGIRFAMYPGLKIFGGGGFIPDNEAVSGREKILDTSVVIDGRILDIAETHFIDGPFIIPNFVLREIQLISDSPDPIKRNRGRRGLEMLNKLQRSGSVKVKISYVDYTDTREVDAKLVKLSRETGAKLITNDFNLNKVAELQGVDVLNLNNLTNALRPVVLPGEDIVIDVIKEGKDPNQGIGYLEDGTMVVIENGGNLLGKTVEVNVTSIIQTAAGKMIFTKATQVIEEEQNSSQGGANSESPVKVGNYQRNQNKGKRQSRADTGSDNRQNRQSRRR